MRQEDQVGKLYIKGRCRSFKKVVMGGGKSGATQGSGK